LTSSGGSRNAEPIAKKGWYIGRFVDASNTRDYLSQSGGFFARYLFRRQGGIELTSAGKELILAQTPARRSSLPSNGFCSPPSPG
jgi:hypothetical protein